MLEQEINKYQQLEFKRMTQQTLNNEEHAFMILFFKIIAQPQVTSQEVDLLKQLVKLI